MQATETRDVGSRRNAAPLLGTMATVTTPTVRPGIAERLSQMIRIPTVSAELEERGPAPFEEFVALIAELYPLTHEKLGLERHTDFGLLFHWEGNGATSDEPVVLMAHYDVVPVDESDDWTHPPFAGVIADGSVYGRGALDDKGPLIVVLEAVENLLADGFVPPRDVYLSFGGNEETYGRAAEEIARVLREPGAPERIRGTRDADALYAVMTQSSAPQAA